MENEGFIAWCFRKKDGIKLVEPNDNLCKAYLKKAEESLGVLRMCLDAKYFETAVVQAYYARYNAVYALFMKCGIKSEIHSCTIALTKKLFLENFGETPIKELEDAQKLRIDAQYYTKLIMNTISIKNVNCAPDFVLRAESIISEFDENKVKEVREKLKKYL